MTPPIGHGSSGALTATGPGPSPCGQLRPPGRLTRHDERVSLETAIRRQHGVLTRAQALEAGLSVEAVRWKLARGDWRRLHPGVYLTHTGPLGWASRAQGALLAAGAGSVLTLDSAAFVWGMTSRPPDVLTIAIPSHRHPAPIAGVRVARRRRLQPTLVTGLWVTRAAPTIVDLADLPDRDFDTVLAVAARAAQRGLVSDNTLLTELAARPRHRHRRFLHLACGELGAGAESVAEILFANRVLRPHRLPVFDRQVLAADGRSRADFRNRALGIVVEIDGRLWHAGERFHTDRQRDRRTAARGEVTVRASWLDVDRRPCQLALDLWQICHRRGWTERPRSCAHGCPLGVAPT